MKHFPSFNDNNLSILIRIDNCHKLSSVIKMTTLGEVEGTLQGEFYVNSKIGVVGEKAFYLLEPDGNVYKKIDIPFDFQDTFQLSENQLVIIPFKPKIPEIKILNTSSGTFKSLKVDSEVIRGIKLVKSFISLIHSDNSIGIWCLNEKLKEPKRLTRFWDENHRIHSHLSFGEGILYSYGYYFSSYCLKNFGSVLNSGLGGIQRISWNPIESNFKLKVEDPSLLPIKTFTIATSSDVKIPIVLSGKRVISLENNRIILRKDADISNWFHLRIIGHSLHKIEDFNDTYDTILCFGKSHLSVPEDPQHSVLQIWKIPKNLERSGYSTHCDMIPEKVINLLSFNYSSLFVFSKEEVVLRLFGYNRREEGVKVNLKSGEVIPFLHNFMEQIKYLIPPSSKRSKILKCLLQLKLRNYLNTDLIGETFSFLS